MTDSGPKLRSLESALDEIGAAGDAARLQLHFLSSRARARSEELAANIEAFEQRLDRGIEHAMGRAATTTRQLSSAVRELLGQTSVTDGLVVRSIMTDAVHACSPDEPLHVAARHMWEHDCGAVPVLSSDGKLAGIVTDRDICMAAYTKGLPLHAIPTRDAMARHVHACGPDDTLERAANLMADAQVRRLPVVDAEQRLVGIVSLADIARYAAALGRSHAAELVFELTRAISRRPPEGFPALHAAE